MARKFKVKQFKFRSRAEAFVAQWLDQQKVEYQFEPTKVPYTSTVTSGLCEACGATKGVVQRRNYIPDFYIPAKKLYIEVKGRLDSKARSKMRDVKKAHPELDIRILFLSNNKLTPKKPERYSDWAKRFDYDYAIKTIPIEWIK